MLQRMFYHPWGKNSTTYHTHLLLSIFLRFVPYLSEYLRPDIHGSYIYMDSPLFLTHRSGAAGHHELLRHLRGVLTGTVAHVEDAVPEHGFLLAVASPRRCWWSQKTEKYPTDADFLDELKQDSLFLGDWFRDFSDSRISWGFGGGLWRKMRKKHQQEWSIHQVSAVFLDSQQKSGDSRRKWRLKLSPSKEMIHQSEHSSNWCTAKLGFMYPLLLSSKQTWQWQFPSLQTILWYIIPVRVGLVRLEDVNF